MSAHDRLFYVCDTLDADGDSSEEPVVRDVRGPVPKEEANLVGSFCEDGFHRPVIDIDWPCRLEPSSTEGHFHLYVDVPVDPDAYFRLLDAMVDAGIVQPFFAKAAKARGGTFCRPPWIKKPTKQEAK